MALAAAEACRQVAGVGPVLKWPNDLLVGEAKLAGVLAEAEFDGSGVVRAVVVGLGLNVDWPGPAGAGGTCLTDLGSAPVDRDALLDALLDALSARRALLDSAPGRREVAAELRQSLRHAGQTGAGRAGGRGRGRAWPPRSTTPVTGGADRARARARSSAGDVVHLRPG